MRLRERKKVQLRKREEAQKKKIEVKAKKVLEQENERKEMELKMKSVVDSNADKDMIQAAATELQVPDSYSPIFDMHAPVLKNDYLH